jgi:hypothetical protein
MMLPSKQKFVLLVLTVSFVGLGSTTDVEVGYMKVSGTGTYDVTEPGFTPDLVEITANQKIESIGVNTQVSDNSGCPQNVNGFSRGVATFDGDTVRKQISVSQGRNSDSTNSHIVASSSSNILNNVYSDEDGNVCGRLQGHINSGLSNGFQLEVTSTYDFNEIISYRAYDFSDESEFEVGFKEITGTGSFDVNTGFQPTYIETITSQELGGTDVETSANFHGQSRGSAVINPDGTPDEQFSISMAAHSGSTDAHRSLATSGYVIDSPYDDDGSVNGRLKASVSGADSTGFSLQVDSYSQDEVVLYKALKLPNANTDIGYRRITGTGTYQIDQIGFNPDYLKTITHQRVSDMDTNYVAPENSGCSNTYGWSDGWADLQKENSLTLSTGRNSDSMNAHRYGSSTGIIQNIYSGQSGSQCGLLDASISGNLSNGFELSVSDHYVDEVMFFRAFEFSFCDERGADDRCIINSERDISGLNRSITPSLKTTENSILEAFDEKGKLWIEGKAFLSGSFRGSLFMEADNVILRPGADLRPENGNIRLENK